MKRIVKKFENAMAAVAFAEEGEDKIARELINESIPAETVSKVKKESFAEKTMEAITFAEAGEHEHAKAIMKREPVSKEKLLVVGSEEGFSERLVSHSIKMAKRLGYEIEALNVIPVGMRIFSVLQDKVKDELKLKTEKDAATFNTKATELKIRFTHAVKFGNRDKIIREISRECEETLFIVTEPEHVSDEVNAAIPVYCIAASS
jgi:hypothetical protein